MNMEQLQGPGITCANLQLLWDRAVTATGARASAGKQGSAQREHTVLPLAPGHTALDGQQTQRVARQAKTLQAEWGLLCTFLEA